MYIIAILLFFLFQVLKNEVERIGMQEESWFYWIEIRKVLQIHNMFSLIHPLFISTF